MLPLPLPSLSTTNFRTKNQPDVAATVAVAPPLLPFAAAASANDANISFGAAKLCRCAAVGVCESISACLPVFECVCVLGASLCVAVVGV